jgi:outer membrane protein assembly factor BamB
MLTTARGRQVVIDGGKAGILIELNAQTGRLIWKLPFGTHNGNDNDGLITEYATPTSPLGLPPQLTVDPGPFGGTESQLATNGSTTFVTGNHFPWQVGSTTGFVFPSLSALVEALAQATGEVDAVDQDTGKFRWVTQLPSTPYGAATVTNDVVFTTTFDGDLYALDANTGAVLLKAPLSAGSNAPVAVDGDYVIVGAGFPLAPGQQPLIIAYKLGAHGQLPDKAGS